MQEQMIAQDIEMTASIPKPIDEVVNAQSGPQIIEEEPQFEERDFIIE